jgi:hypothetical protein
MSGLTNGYLSEIGKKIIGKTFLGSFPCDLTPKVNRKTNFSLILNLSKYNEKGTHFVAIFADEKRILYFDPLGNKCENKDIIKFIKENKKNRKVYKKFPKIQSDDSIFCGFYCLGFLLAMTRKIKNFFKHFPNNPNIKNDSFVIKFIKDNL